MRKIKFRVWIKRAQQMATWEEIQQRKNIHRLLDNGEYQLMQYTGLSDKNGVDIYERDVVTLDNRETFKEIKWWVGGYYFDDGSPVSDYTNIEVIGNIYENPELIGDI